MDSSQFQPSTTVGLRRVRSHVSGLRLLLGVFGQKEPSSPAPQAHLSQNSGVGLRK
ncbi:Hypothetical predicted protein, partial [Marmota monax]